MSLNISAATQQKTLLATCLVRQHDNLVQEEIATRYSYEMAKSRPQMSQEVVKDTARYEQQNQQKQWEILQLLSMAERVTGHSIETLREFGDQLTTLIGRHVEVGQELRQRELLSPVLRAALEGQSVQDDETIDALAKLDAAADDIPVLEAHLAKLAAKADELAAHIQYNSVSNLITTPQLVSL